MKGGEIGKKKKRSEEQRIEGGGKEGSRGEDDKGE